MAFPKVRRVAVIGAGPAGAITVDALAQERAFDVIRVFERREAAGGCWSVFPKSTTADRANIDRVGDTTKPPTETNLGALAARSADPPLPIPSVLPSFTCKAPQKRFTDSSIYPYLESNIDHVPMQFTQEPIPSVQSKRSVELHGEDTPFRHWTVMREYVQSLVKRRGYEDFLSYRTTVELAEKRGSEWKLVLRKEGVERDYWWVEWFDAVVVASGHYSVPYIPSIVGLEAMEKSRPGSIVHSKHFRGKDLYKGKVRPISQLGTSYRRAYRCS